MIASVYYQINFLLSKSGDVFWYHLQRRLLAVSEFKFLIPFP